MQLKEHKYPPSALWALLAQARYLPHVPQHPGCTWDVSHGASVAFMTFLHNLATSSLGGQGQTLLSVLHVPTFSTLPKSLTTHQLRECLKTREWQLVGSYAVSWRKTAFKSTVLRSVS